MGKRISRQIYKIRTRNWFLEVGKWYLYIHFSVLEVLSLYCQAKISITMRLACAEIIQDNWAFYMTVKLGFVEIRHFRKCLISVNFFDIQNKLKILVFKLDLRALSLESLYSIFLFLLFFALKTFFVATERNALENNLNGLFCSETFQIATSSHIRRKFCIILQFVPILYVLLDR